MEQKKRTDVTDLKHRQKAPKRVQMKLNQRLRALLEQEEHCRKRAFLQQELFETQRSKKPNKRDSRGVLLLNILRTESRSQNIGQLGQEPHVQQTLRRSIGLFSGSSSASFGTLSFARKPKRELLEAERRPALSVRGAIERGCCLVNGEEPVHLDASAVSTSNLDSHARGGTTCACRVKTIVIKSELAPSATSPRECITISDSSGDRSRCSSPAAHVPQREDLEKALGDISRLPRETADNSSRDPPASRRQDTASCRRGGNNDGAGSLYDELASIAGEEGGDGKRGESTPGGRACSMPTASTDTDGLEDFFLSTGHHTAMRDARCVRRVEDMATPQTRAEDDLRGLSAGDWQEPTNQREDGCAVGADGKSADSEGKPSIVSGWPECVVEMLGPDVFNVLKEEPQLVHATSKTSGMSVFHHMLRRPSRDDEQVLDLFKCIYEDEPLKERVSLPPLTALKCDRGQTLAFYAAAYGHPKCLKWILEQIGGASSQRQFLEIRDSEGDTPLHYAVKNGHASVIEMLLNIVPEMLNKQRSNGQTPIFDSLERPAILRLLLRHGADYRVRCSRGLTPLETATDELRWKRLCSSRSCKALKKRLSFSVHLLKKAEGDGGKGGVGDCTRQDHGTLSNTTGSTAKSSDRSNSVEPFTMVDQAVDDWGSHHGRSGVVDPHLHKHP